MNSMFLRWTIPTHWSRAPIERGYTMAVQMTLMDRHSRPVGTGAGRDPIASHAAHIPRRLENAAPIDTWKQVP